MTIVIMKKSSSRSFSTFCILYLVRTLSAGVYFVIFPDPRGFRTFPGARCCSALLQQLIGQRIDHGRRHHSADSVAISSRRRCSAIQEMSLISLSLLLDIDFFVENRFSRKIFRRSKIFDKKFRD